MTINRIAGSTLVLAIMLMLYGCGGGDQAPEETNAGTNNQETTDASGTNHTGDQSGTGNSSLAPSVPSSASNPIGSLHVMTPPGQKPVVEFDTTEGKILVELDNESAPKTVDHFLAFVRRGFYDDTIFHAVYPGTILAGNFMENHMEKIAGRTVENEANNGLSNRRGTIAMSRVPHLKDSAGAQFFFNVKDNTDYDYQDDSDEGYGYCVFGTVTGGLDIIDRIAQKPTKEEDIFDAMPVEPIVIKSVRIIR